MIATLLNGFSRFVLIIRNENTYSANNGLTAAVLMAWEAVGNAPSIPCAIQKQFGA